MSSDSAGSIPGTEKPGEFENPTTYDRIQISLEDLSKAEAKLRQHMAKTYAAADARRSRHMLPMCLAIEGPEIAQLLVVGIDGITIAILPMADDRTPIEIEDMPAIRPDRVVFVDSRDLCADVIGRTVAAIAGPGRTRARGSPRRR